MKPENTQTVMALLKRREALIEDLNHVLNGRVDVTIFGRYQRDKLSPVSQRRLDQVMHDFTTENIAYVDKELASFGIYMDDGLANYALPELPVFDPLTGL